MAVGRLGRRLSPDPFANYPLSSPSSDKSIYSQENIHLANIQSQFRQIYLYQTHIDPVQTKNPSPWQSSSDKFTFIRPTSIQSQQNIRHPDNPVLTNLLFYQTQNLGFSFVTDSLIIVYIILEGWISQYLPSDFVLKLASQKAPPPPPEAKPSHQSSNRGLCEYNGKRKSTYSLIRSLQPQFLHCLSAWMQSVWTPLSAPPVFIACLSWQTWNLSQESLSDLIFLCRYFLCNLSIN